MGLTVTFGWTGGLALLFAIVSYVHCECTVIPAKIETTYTGRVRHYCVHNVTKGNASVEIELLLDSKFETRDCQRCTCSRLGLTCCGYGVASQDPIHVPKGCHPVPDGCRIALISDIDNVTDCYSIGPAAEERRRNEMMMGMARRIANQQYPQAMQFWQGLNPPPVNPIDVLLGGGRRPTPTGRPAERPEGLMESFLLMNIFGGGMDVGGGMNVGGSSQSGFRRPSPGVGSPAGHTGGGRQNTNGFSMGMGGLGGRQNMDGFSMGMGGLGGSLFESPLGMGLLFSSFMN